VVDSCHSDWASATPDSSAAPGDSVTADSVWDCHSSVVVSEDSAVLMADTEEVTETAMEVVQITETVTGTISLKTADPTAVDHSNNRVDLTVVSRNNKVDLMEVEMVDTDDRTEELL